MDEGLNSAEQFIFQLCKRSFLRLWSYANPRGKEAGKELCDVLIVCPPDVLIFSVKEIAYKETGNDDVDTSRWLKRAVEASTKQIYGAERLVRSSLHVVRSDGSTGLEFPLAPDIRLHRVAVAIGSRGKVPLPFGDFGKGFVHVFDEVSAEILLRELDTVSDFIGYLKAKENFCSGVSGLVQVREEDLLAIYLHNGRRFPDRRPDVLTVSDDLWAEFIAKPEYAAKKKADQTSYSWDNLIEIFTEDILGNNLEPGASPSDAERALRLTARECRFSRRILGEAFSEFLLESENYSLARMLRTPSGIVYVFLAAPRDQDREFRQKELQLRYFVARGLNASSTTVVGIATEQYHREGCSLDIAVHQQHDWEQKDTDAVRQIQADLGYFANPRATPQSYDEYPTSNRAADREVTSFGLDAAAATVCTTSQQR